MLWYVINIVYDTIWWGLMQRDIWYHMWYMIYDIVYDTIWWGMMQRDIWYHTWYMSDTIFCDMTWHCMKLYDMRWCDMRCDTVRYSTLRYDTMLHVMIWYDKVYVTLDSEIVKISRPVSFLLFLYKFIEWVARVLFGQTVGWKRSTWSIPASLLSVPKHHYFMYEMIYF